MNTEELFKLRKLRKIAPDLEKSKISLLVSQSKLEKSRALYKSNFFEQGILESYGSMFHAARALLYRDGVQEKSHFAVYIYLKEKYSRKIPSIIIESFLNYQKERKYILYGLENNSFSKDDCEDAFNSASDFLKLIRGQLKL